MNDKYLGDNLIFIISQPRSGSTLLQRVLSGHPEIQTSAETWLLLHPAYAFRTQGIATEYDSKFAAQGVEEFLTNYADGMEVYDDAIREWARVIYDNALHKNNKTYFLDKTPRYFFIIPDLYRLFPRAKFIFLLRNPMAVLSSILSTYIKKDWPVISFFQPDLLKAPSVILEGMALLGDDATVIRYEEFVAAPEDNISRLCQALDITYHKEMLDYSHTDAPKGSLNDPVGIHQHTRPSMDSLDKWKKLSDDAQTRHFAQAYLHHLGHNVIAQLGYSFTDINNALRHTGDVHPRGEALYPWDIAIRPQQEWTFREQFISDRYFSVQKKGYARGSLRILKRYIKRGLKSLGHQLSRVKLPR
jgi:hypothetical protein